MGFVGKKAVSQGPKKPARGNACAWRMACMRRNRKVFREQTRTAEPHPNKAKNPESLPAEICARLTLGGEGSGQRAKISCAGGRRKRNEFMAIEEGSADVRGDRIDV